MKGISSLSQIKMFTELIFCRQMSLNVLYGTKKNKKCFYYTIFKSKNLFSRTTTFLNSAYVLYGAESTGPGVQKERGAGPEP